ncbi:DUF4145 domain-containing protein [Rhodobacter sp. CZR27]|uniref:DUF4145 domain-containing protein n=1 Tax=Rhodobacter sp. CZR27 TaxID=2033869 RepID=UPI0012FE70AB|nr:DUF4145 domain-containing protein [Rhodobacter sp. CZR27]
MASGMRSQNFDHLLEIDRPLAVLASHAERYFVDDANTALIKTRQFAERMTRVVAENAGVVMTADDTFSGMLRTIRRDDLVPSENLDVLHGLRVDGNAAVHGHAGERRKAFEALNTLLKNPDLDAECRTWFTLAGRTRGSPDARDGRDERIALQLRRP